MRLRLTNNKRFVLYIAATVLIFYSIAVLPSAFTARHFHEKTVEMSLYMLSACCLVAGVAMLRIFRPHSFRVKMRINYFTTIFVWLMMIIITAIPFYCANKSISVVDSLFEATCAWTTTGSGTISASALPFGLQMLRSTCNWMGAVGIIILAVNSIRRLHISEHELALTEITGPDFMKSSVTFRKTYGLILIIYAILTAVSFLLLVLFGMNPFEAVLSSLSSISTAGLQHIHNGYIIHLKTSLKVILTIFAFLGSVNCSFFILIFSRRFSQLAHRTELRGYFFRIVLSSLIIAAFLEITGVGESMLAEFGEVLMQVISFLSTSGYIVTDCGSWPTFCIIIIILQMFIGSCAVSTGGGIKNARFIVAARTVRHGLFSHIHPRAVKPVTFNHKPLTNPEVVRANLYLLLFMMTYMFGALLLSAQGLDVSSALNWSQAMITNTGTSVGELSRPGIVSGFTDFSKLVMCALMLAGRLEIYPLLMLFSRSFWKPDKNA